MTKQDLPIKEISNLSGQFQVRELSVFGSVARGEAREDSDVDFLVEFDLTAKIDYFHFLDLQDRLSELTHRPVDLVSKRGLKRVIRDQVLSEAEVVYAV